MAEERLRLCMLSGSFEYDSEGSLKLFRDYVERARPVRCSVVVFRSEDDPQSLAPVEDCDALLLFTRRLLTTGAELERLKAYCAAGRPIVGVRTASHGFQHWLEFDRQVLGGNYQLHYESGPIVDAEPPAGAKKHPILKGVTGVRSAGSLYKNTPLAPDATLLLAGRTEQHQEPVAWSRLHNGGRVFYTSFGHQGDFRDETFLRLLANGVMWVAGRT